MDKFHEADCIEQLVSHPLNSHFVGYERDCRQAFAFCGWNKAGIGIVSWKQGWGKLSFGRSIINEPICLADKEYGWGFGTHADSEIVLRCSKPIKTFRAWTGVDRNRNSIKGTAEMVFAVQMNDNVLAESRSLSVSKILIRKRYLLITIGSMPAGMVRPVLVPMNSIQQGGVLKARIGELTAKFFQKDFAPLVTCFMLPEGNFFSGLNRKMPSVVCRLHRNTLTGSSAPKKTKGTFCY